MRRLFEIAKRIDWLEGIGYISLAVLGLGLWRLNDTIALIVLGGIGFIVTVLALRNRKAR